MSGPASISRLDLGSSPGSLAALNAGLQAWGHPGMLATAGEVSGALSYRRTEINGANGYEKWFEVGFTAPNLLVGDASRGWVDSSGRIRFWLEWSEDLFHWTTASFIDAAAPTPVAGGYEYWARSIWPMDSAASSGEIICESIGDSNDDARNNPFTALTINSVVQTLPNFPYTMPTDAALLQTDIRAAGWTGATVVASSDIAWAITIPNVSHSTYYTTNAVYWPQYYIADYLGNQTVKVWSRGFSGQYVNSAGTRTKLRKQFARLGILPL